jgi:hypothetical protein
MILLIGLKAISIIKLFDICAPSISSYILVILSQGTSEFIVSLVFLTVILENIMISL